MKKQRFALLAILFCIAFAAVSVITVSGQRAVLREAKIGTLAPKPAPPAAIAVLRKFMAYLKKAKPDIAKDEAAQKLFLSKRMRSAMLGYGDRAEKRARKAEEDKEQLKIDFPSNQDFIGVWNNPTTYTIVGSRHYDNRNSHNPHDNRAIVDVLYEWDASESIDNQYPNERQLHSFIFFLEDGMWKLDDVYIFNDEYTSATSLAQFFINSVQ